MATSNFDHVCDILSDTLRGTTRSEMVGDISTAPNLALALERLRDAMRRNVWKAGGRRIDLASVVKTFDEQTRREGLHVLHDWDGVSEVVNEDTIPVDVLNYLIGQRGAGASDRAVVAMLVDYYFLYVLSLVAMRVWDDGDADANLDRLEELRGALQSSDGGGQVFADDAETLLLIATSHFEMNERGYDQLLDKVRTLNRAHRLNVAIGHAESMGCHLRFGFEATYARDPEAMRADNAADYPWLLFALTTVMEAYAGHDHADAEVSDRLVLAEALANGLAADPGAFVGKTPPACLSAHREEWAEFRDRFAASRASLVEDFEPLRPTGSAYSPLSFFFNFSQNVLKGTVVDALLWGEPWPISLNALLTGVPRDSPQAPTKEKLAKVLMGYARANPDRIRGELRPVIVYDPQAGRRAFAAAMREL